MDSLKDFVGEMLPALVAVIVAIAFGLPQKVKNALGL